VNFFDRKLALIELEILSTKNIVNGLRTEFWVKFEIRNFLVRNIRFETTGFIETHEPIDFSMLEEILAETDYDSLIQQNMTNRDRGRFEQKQNYRGKQLSLTYDTF
jgi:hypothetical protein